MSASPDSIDRVCEEPAPWCTPERPIVRNPRVEPTPKHIPWRALLFDWIGFLLLIAATGLLLLAFSRATPGESFAFDRLMQLELGAAMLCGATGFVWQLVRA